MITNFVLNNFEAPQGAKARLTDEQNNTTRATYDENSKMIFTPFFSFSLSLSLGELPDLIDSKFRLLLAIFSPHFVGHVFWLSIKLKQIFNIQQKYIRGYTISLNINFTDSFQISFKWIILIPLILSL